MKLTENKTARLQIRLTEEDLKLLKISAFSIGSTPSQLIRMFIDTTINTLKIKINKGEINIADFETLFDDKL